MARRNLPFGSAIPMEPGERDRRVTIQQLTAAKAGSGYPKETWTTLQTAWMRKLEISSGLGRASEKFKASQTAASIETQWEMGYSADMDPEAVDVPATRRLVYQGRIYDITAASMIGRREGIELLTIAKTGVAS